MKRLTREQLAEKIRWPYIIWGFGILNVAAMLPQLLKLIQTRQTVGLAVEMFIIYGVIQIAFAFDGYFKRNNVLMVCMALSAAVTATIIGLVIYFRQLGG